MSRAAYENLLEAFRLAISKTSSHFDSDALSLLAQDLAALGTRLQPDRFPRAQPGEELVYPLIEQSQGPSLYIVSDGVGTSSPPHEHQTWALIVGLAGNEMNTFYSLSTAEPDVPIPAHRRNVSAGDFVVLDSSAIHSTSVAGTEPTYHLHLYGRALSSLPPFAARSYQRVAEQSLQLDTQQQGYPATARRLTRR
jgi:predicted metal-dependent enzyme (double-stranded beta helix superfamily)